MSLGLVQAFFSIGLVADVPDLAPYWRRLSKT